MKKVLLILLALAGVPVFGDQTQQWLQSTYNKTSLALQKGDLEAACRYVSPGTVERYKNFYLVPYFGKEANRNAMPCENTFVWDQVEAVQREGDTVKVWVTRVRLRLLSLQKGNPGPGAAFPRNLGLEAQKAHGLARGRQGK